MLRCKAQRKLRIVQCAIRGRDRENPVRPNAAILCEPKGVNRGEGNADSRTATTLGLSCEELPLLVRQRLKPAAADLCEDDVEVHLHA